MHLLPEGERAFLFDVISGLRGERVLFCASARKTSEVAPIPIPFGQRKIIGNLNREETRSLITDILKQRNVILSESEGSTFSVSDPLLDFIFQKTGGNPLFISALLDKLMSQGLIVKGMDPRFQLSAGMTEGEGVFDLADKQAIQGVPYTLRGLLQSRVDGLSPEAKRLFQLISVISLNEEVDLTLLQNLSRHEMVRRIFGMDPSLRWDDRGALEEVKELPTHSLYKDVAYETMPLAMRTELHSLVSIVLELTYPREKIVDQMVYHLRRAGQKSRFAQWLEIAIERAVSEYQMDKVIALSKEALALDLTHQRRVNISRRLSDAYSHIGEKDPALEVAQAALPFASKPEKVSFLVQIAQLYRKQGLMNEARAAADLALDEAKEVGDPKCLMLAVKMRGNIAYVEGDNAKARECYVFSLGVAARENDIVEQARLHFNLGLLQGRETNDGQDIAYFQRAYELERKVGNPIGEADALFAMTEALVKLGKTEEVKARLEEILKIYKSLGNLEGQAGIYRKLGRLNLDEKNWDQAQTYLIQASRIAEKTREIGQLISIYEDLGRLELERKQGNYLVQAREYFQRAYDLAIQFGDPEKIVSTLIYQGLERRKSVYTVEALRKFQEAYKLANNGVSKDTLGSCLVNIAIAYVDLGAHETATEWAKTAEAHLQKFPRPSDLKELKREVWDKLPPSVSDFDRGLERAAGTIHLDNATPRPDARETKEKDPKARRRGSKGHPFHGK